MIIYDLINVCFKHIFTLVKLFKKDRKTNIGVCRLTYSNDIKATLNQNNSQAHYSDTIKKYAK